MLAFPMVEGEDDCWSTPLAIEVFFDNIFVYIFMYSFVCASFRNSYASHLYCIKIFFAQSSRFVRSEFLFEDFMSKPPSPFNSLCTFAKICRIFQQCFLQILTLMM